MQRTVVIRHHAHGEENVNNEIGLEPYSSYSVSEYLEDLATDGVTVLAHHGNVYALSNGTVEILQQRMERIPVDTLDELTRSLVVENAAMRLPQFSSAALPVC